MENSAKNLTRARAFETEKHPLALSNTFGVLSSIKEESNEEIATLEDDSSQQTAEVSFERASSRIQCRTSAMRNNTASTSGGAFSSLARKTAGLPREAVPRIEMLSGRGQVMEKAKLGGRR